MIVQEVAIHTFHIHKARPFYVSGDEVDLDLIIPGGRGSRRGRRASGHGTGSARPKYQAKATLESDEDEW